MEAADIIATTYDARTKQPATLSDDPDVAADQIGRGDYYTINRCSADGTIVRTVAVGTREDAYCRRGHHWLYTFDRNAPGYRQVP